MSSNSANESYGGLPPKIQLNIALPRKSAQPSGTPPSTSPPPLAPDQAAQVPDLVYEQKPFTDHTGNAGLSIYRGRVKKGQTPLLPPWSWQIYITYGASAADCGSVPLNLYTSLIEQLSTETMQWFRFDFLFLRGADNVACIRHYRGEKRFRAGGELALVPTYGGYAASGQALNTLIVVDRRDWESEGVVWLQFDGEEEGEKEAGAEVPEGFSRPTGRARALEKPYVPGTAFVGESMDQVYRLSRIRGEWEREFLLAKEMMEM